MRKIEILDIDKAIKLEVVKNDEHKKLNVDLFGFGISNTEDGEYSLRNRVKEQLQSYYSNLGVY